VSIQITPQSAIYSFRASDGDHLEAVRASVRELAARYNAYASEHRTRLPRAYAPGAADDRGDERDWDTVPLLPHVRAKAENAADGAQMVLDVPDPDLVDELREYVKSDVDRLEEGVCQSLEDAESGAGTSKDPRQRQTQETQQP